MSTLENGHVADMYHAGTRSYYRVQVLQPITIEAEGPAYDSIDSIDSITAVGLAGAPVAQVAQGDDLGDERYRPDSGWQTP